MSRKPDSPVKRRPNYFWWALINILALVFAILSWTGCYYVFHFPEKPHNYAILQKLGRLPSLDFFEAGKLPKATTLPPKQLYAMIYDREQANTGPDKLMDAATLQTLNLQLKRNYITHFEKPLNLNYVRGTWRIQQVRELSSEDFISSGFAVLAKALVIPGDQEDSTNPDRLPFPVELEILLPTASGVQIPPNTEITTDNSIEIDRSRNGLAIIHIAQEGAADEPVTRLTTIPLLANPFALTKNSKIALTAPTRLNIQAPFPLFETEAE